MKSSLKILSLAEWDYAGVGYLLSNAINSTTNSESMAIRWAEGAYTQYPYEVLKPSRSRLADLWKRADVIHIHDAFGHIPADWQAKPTVITYHGSMYRRGPKVHNQMCQKNYWIPTCSTLDLSLYGPHWMPDTRELQDEPERHKDFTFCHAPTSRPGKSTENVLAACKAAGVKLELIERVSWAEAMRRKARCHALIDQFTLGYGCNAIEAWMFGMPVVANAKDQAITRLMKITFGGELPFVQAADKPRAIADALLRLQDDNQYYNEMAERGKQHALKFHSPQATAERAIGYYHKAIELFYTRPAVGVPQTTRDATRGLPGRDGMVLLRYLGGNIGTEEYIGKETGTKYIFSAGDALKYVDARDATHMLAMRSTSTRSRPKLFEEV